MTASLRTRLAVGAWRVGIGSAAVATTPMRRAQLGGLGVEPHRYGEHRLERIDRIHDPRAGVDARARAPVLYVHGGGWVSGTRRLYRGELAFLARAGHEVWNADYPLAPESPYPGPLRSVLRALAWLAADPRGIDRVVLVGDSAGGNLVTMAALVLADPALRAALEPGERRYPRIERVVSLYGVLDRLTWLEDGFPGARTFLESYGGRPAFEAEVGPELALTPMDLAHGAHPPMLLAVGGLDPLRRSTELFAERLRAGGGEVELHVYPREPHAFFNLPWSGARRAVKREILRFLAPAAER